MSAPTVEQIAGVLRPHLSLSGRWSPEMNAAANAVPWRDDPRLLSEAKAAALDVYARQVAEQVAALTPALEPSTEHDAQVLLDAADAIEEDGQFAADYFSDALRARATRIAAGERP